MPSAYFQIIRGVALPSGGGNNQIRFRCDTDGKVIWLTATSACEMRFDAAAARQLALDLLTAVNDISPADEQIGWAALAAVKG